MISSLPIPNHAITYSYLFRPLFCIGRIHGSLNDVIQIFGIAFVIQMAMTVYDREIVHRSTLPYSGSNQSPADDDLGSKKTVKRPDIC